jgi:hypothetical protein
VNLNILLITLFVFWSLGTLLNAQQLASYKNYYKIVSQTPQALVISFEFEHVKIRNAGDTNYNVKIFEIPGLAFNYVNGRPLLPVMSLPLTLPEGKRTVSVRVEQAENFPRMYPLEFIDQPNNPNTDQKSALRPGKAAAAKAQVYTSVYPEQVCELEDMGLFRDYQLSVLRILPLQVTANGIKFYKKFTVTISFSNITRSSKAIPPGESRLLKNFVINKEHLNLVSPRTSVYSGASTASRLSAGSVDSRVKIILDEEGIYSVTGEDLQNAGVRIEDINPTTFRLSSKGKDVAFFLAGDQDNRFDPDDYFEFWGERNEKTFLPQYPDQYADPFSDDNVYWLEWGGSGGLRMVQENGSLISTQPGQYNPSFFYSHTIHVEENRQFERLGEGSLEQLSYTRDLWFFDAGIKAVGKKQYPFQLIFPDESSFRPVYVTAMFSGKSFGGHNVMVWLNNGFVGSAASGWYSQDTARISNINNSSLRTSDLLHGENILEVQLPSLPSNETDIVLLNWFDVTYDRLYRAYKNEIKLRRPAFIPYPNTDLFQFDIDNFRSPDIEIYKKGISKIVNFKIDVEVINDTNIYKISFQDNVPSDDIEYLTITGDKKKKPLSIEKDKPFDPETPQRTLRETGNAAEYIIITHNRFFENAEVLLDYRRSQGVAAELVDVKDIYDEFNFGIKSPLAIQEFLRYAFFNWSRTPRLKYVVLLGDANFNYKSKSAVALDFVPTLFYQTQEFGAAATDYPYALVSGNDEIPDLFVGRLPVTTNSEANDVIEKIIEFEQNPPVNAWKNRSLFISGNDRTTYELATDNPAFRAQNFRIIESLLPKNLSAVRLNTIKDPALPFDPNFGSSSDLRDHFEDGLFYINFMGHGGGGIWADVRLMDLNDVDNLNNGGMYPFITSMTCFTGAFENPSSLGLAQKLLLAPEKGAIGIFASSGLGYLHNDYAMLWNIGQFMFDPSLTVGEIITLGTILYWSEGANYGVINGNSTFTPGYYQVRHEMVYQYNLIGDPYIKLQFAEDKISVTPSTVTPQQGDVLDVTITTGLFSADGYLELVDAQFNIADRLPLFGISPGATIPLTIPQDFPEGTGLIRVYLSDGSRDESGQVAIGINHAVLTSLEFLPPEPKVDDTVYVNLRVQDVHGIRRVYLFRETNPDTIFAVQSSSDSFLYIAKMKPAFRLQTVPFEVHVENNVGNVSIFRNLSYVVTDSRPDIFPVAGSLKFTGREKTQLKVAVSNAAGAGVDDLIKVNVHFADGESNFMIGEFFTTGQVYLSSADSASVIVDFPLELNRSEYHIYIKAEVDPSEDVQDFNPQNNFLDQKLKTTIFNVTAAGSDTISLGSAYRVYFPPGSISDSSAVRLEVVEFPKPEDQGGLIPIALLNQAQYHALKVDLLNPAVSQQSPFNLFVTLNPAFIDTTRYFVEDITLYEKLNDTQPWVSTLFSGNGTTKIITAFPQRNALYAPFVSFDRNAPRIELTVDGRPLQVSGLVSPTPALYLIVQDESGVNLQKDKISITLDGNLIPEEKIFIPDSVQKNNVLGITINPNLTRGRHRLDVSVQDVNGNSSAKEFQLVVSDEFDIIVYGNYPNPFQDQTIFAYFVQLDDDLDEFEIRIYTVSGRLIRKIDSDINNGISDPDGGARRKGYNELIWDGRDELGNEVANGVYFAVVKGNYQGESKEKTLKVAKLR